MRLKQKLAAMLAVLLIMLHAFPAFAIAADELQKQTETVIIQDSGTPSEPPLSGELPPSQEKPPDAVPEPETSPAVKPSSPSDADVPQESESPETGSGSTESSPPEENNATVGTSEILPSDVVKSVQEAPSLTTELVMEGDEPGLSITLKNVPQNLSGVTVKYAFGSPAYIAEDFSPKAWYTTPGEDEARCQVDADGSVRILCYGLDEHPLSAYLSEAVNTLWIQVSYATEDYADGMTFEPVRFSHENTYEIPKTPPPFTAEFVLGWFSYAAVGHFTDFPPNVAQVSSTYSWDGITYQSSVPGGPMRWDMQRLGSVDTADKDWLQNQECAKYYCEPLKSFLAHEQDSFYLRLEITTEEGEVYYSQPALMSRGETEAIPEHLIPRAYMGFDMAVSESRNDKGLSEDDENYYAEMVNYTYGQLQLTVREDATWEEIRALLPDTVPVRVRFWDKQTKEKVVFGDVSCQISWKEPPEFSLTPGEPLTLEDMAEPLVIPADTVVKTDLAEYILTQPLTFNSPYDSDDIRIILNPIAADEEPQVGLRAGEDWDGNDVMSLAFWQKPSGATAIEAYVIVGEQRSLLCDLLDRRDVNHNQSHALYGYVPLLRADEAPYADYLSGSLDSFAIELVMKGGVYDGKTVTLPWPQDYQLPEEVFDPSGSEGNENNAGSGGEDSNEGGQRPDLPDEEAPPINIPPPDASNPPDNSGTTPSTPENSEPSVPSLPDGNATPSPPTNTTENGEGTVSPKPPADSDTMLPTEVVGKDTPPPAEHPPVTNHGNTSVAQNEPDNGETVASNPTEPEVDEAAELPVWNETKPQEQTREKSDAQAVAREASNAEKTGGFPMAATAVVVLVGGGIAVSAGIGAASGTVSGSGFGGKLLRTLRKLFHRP